MRRTSVSRSRATAQPACSGPESTKHFGPGPQTAMVNYRVDDLDGILVQLEAAGATIDPKREDADYGKFAWAVDPEGNRFELWQPL
jgi:predicted enzyme related to lactoylglutathione lyase